jgi:hypothetical protein
VEAEQGVHVDALEDPTALDFVFSGQRVQVLWPGLGLNPPGLQGVQDAGVTGYVPDGHVETVKLQLGAPLVL